MISYITNGSWTLTILRFQRSVLSGGCGMKSLLGRRWRHHSLLFPEEGFQAMSALCFAEKRADRPLASPSPRRRFSGEGWRGSCCVSSEEDSLGQSRQYPQGHARALLQPRLRGSQVAYLRACPVALDVAWSVPHSPATSLTTQKSSRRGDVTRNATPRTHRGGASRWTRVQVLA